jgi:hypothetical protein
MLSDSSHEIRQQADSALSEFLQEIKNSPVRLLLIFRFLIDFVTFQCQILTFCHYPFFFVHLSFSDSSSATLEVCRLWSNG